MDHVRPGLFTRTDARSSGCSDDELRTLCDSGALVRIRPGFYIRASEYMSLNRTEQHVVLARAMVAHDPGVVLSHVSAAIVWGLDVWNIPLNRAHFTSGRSITSKKSRRRIVHGTSMSDHERTTKDGLRLTTVARTVVDVARTVPLEQAVCVGDSALRRGLTSSAELRESVISARSRTGIARARTAVGAMTERSESVGESRSRILIHTLDLPTPLLNQWVYDGNGRFLARVDFLFPEQGVIGEFDGEGKYGSSPREAIIAEKNRQNRLLDAGWIVVRWDWKDLANPDALDNRIRQALARAEKLPAPVGVFSPARLA